MKTAVAKQFDFKLMGIKNNNKIKTDVVLSLNYYYKGSSNIGLRLVQESEVILLYSDYNELINTVYTANELAIIIQELENEVYD